MGGVILKVRKRGRLETFETMGKWWTKDNPDKMVTGTLKYTPEEITLDLIGVLGEDYFLNFENETPEEIYGISVGGESFKLDVLNRSGTRSSSPGIPIETYNVRSFLAGNYTEEFPESFDNVLFSADYLTPWIDPGVFEEERSTKDNYYKIEYFPPETKEYKIKSINTTIEEYFIGNTKRDFISKVEINASHTSWFKISPDENKNLTWFLDIVRSFKGFLNLLLDYTTSDEHILFRVFKKEEKRYLEYKYFESIKEVKKKKRNIQFLFKYNDVKENLESILNNWFEKEEKLKTIISFHLVNFERLYLDTKFINSVQTLEIFHRRFYEGAKIDQELYSDNTKKIKQFIIENIKDEEVKSFFLNKFNHGNEYNLGRRLKELINGLSQDVKIFLIGNSENRDRFIQKVVETRNYLTHFDYTNKKMVLEEPIGKFYAAYRMKVILIFIVLKELGLEEELIFKKVKEHRTMSTFLDQSKEVLNKKK